MTSRNNTAPQKKNLKPNTEATTGKRLTNYCELLGGLSGEESGAVVRKLGLITPLRGVENSLV